MCAFDRAHAFGFLDIADALAERFHFRPMHFWTEMMLGVITVVEKEPVVNFSVTAHAPGDRFVGIGAVMPVVAVQLTEAVPEIPKRHEVKNDVAPVKEKHGEQRDRERRQFEISPKHITVAAFAQFAPYRADIISKETEKHIAPGIFRFAIVAVAIDRQ